MECERSVLSHFTFFQPDLSGFVSLSFYLGYEKTDVLRPVPISFSFAQDKVRITPDLSGLPHLARQHRDDKSGLEVYMGYELQVHGVKRSHLWVRNLLARRLRLQGNSPISPKIGS